MKSLAGIAIALGFLLLLLSGLSSTLFSGRASWTDEKAARRAAVQDRIHNLRFQLQAPRGGLKMHSHASSEEKSSGPRDVIALKAEFDELTAENDALNAEFQSVHDRPAKVASIFKWSGIMLAMAGLVGWYAANQSQR